MALGLACGGTAVPTATTDAGPVNADGAGRSGSPDAADTAGASGVADAADTADTAGASGVDAPATAKDTSPSDGAAVSTRDLSTDRAQFFGAPRCAQAKVQLCEDFESGALDAATWKTVGAKPVVDGLQSARGGKALHVMVTGNGQSGIRESKTFPAVDNTYFGRMFVYFKALPTSVAGFTYAHWTVIAASGTQVSGEIRVSGQMGQAGNIWGVGTDNRTDPNGTGDWTNSDKDPAGKPVPVPTDQWLCVEWMHKGSSNETRFWWDGVEHPSLHTVPNTAHGGNPTQPYILPQFTNVWLGWQEYQATTQPFELWIDEIAIDQARIGCVL